MGNEDKRDEAIREEAEKRIEEQKASGKSWQERETRMVADALTDGEGGRGELAKKVANEAFQGQDAGEILGSAAFEAASPNLLDQPLLLIYQEAEFVSVNDKYNYALADGTPVALGEQTNQGLGRKAMRLVSKLDSALKTVIEVVQDGEKVFEMERKGSIGKNTMVIRDAGGEEIGEVKQTKRGSKRASFELRAGGSTLASMQTGRLHAGSGFDIIAADGEVVAWVRRLHTGVLDAIGTAFKSSPDNYALRLARPLEDPLRTLVVATPMAVDSAINQDESGLSLSDVSRNLRRMTR